MTNIEQAILEAAELEAEVNEILSTGILPNNMDDLNGPIVEISGKYEGIVGE